MFACEIMEEKKQLNLIVVEIIRKSIPYPIYIYLLFIHKILTIYLYVVRYRKKYFYLFGFLILFSFF